ncbi:hypothetical protein ACFLZV_05910, partial [Candidatus Margulisiibacteriota bacterium]
MSIVKHKYISFEQVESNVSKAKIKEIFSSGYPGFWKINSVFTEFLNNHRHPSVKNIEQVCAFLDEFLSALVKNDPPKNMCLSFIKKAGLAEKQQLRLLSSVIKKIMHNDINTSGINKEKIEFFLLETLAETMWNKQDKVALKKIIRNLSNEKKLQLLAYGYKQGREGSTCIKFVMEGFIYNESNSKSKHSKQFKELITYLDSEYFDRNMFFELAFKNTKQLPDILKALKKKAKENEIRVFKAINSLV